MTTAHASTSDIHGLTAASPVEAFLAVEDPAERIAVLTAISRLRGNTLPPHLAWARTAAFIELRDGLAWLLHDIGAACGTYCDGRGLSGSAIWQALRTPVAAEIRRMRAAGHALTPPSESESAR